MCTFKLGKKKLGATSMSGPAILRGHHDLYFCLFFRNTNTKTYTSTKSIITWEEKATSMLGPAILLGHHDLYFCLFLYKYKYKY